MKLRTKLSLFLIALSVGILAATGIFIDFELEKYFKTRLLNELDTQINQLDYTFRYLVPIDTDTDSIYMDYRKIASNSNFRLTLIAENGKVIFESEKTKDQLNQIDNHLNRPEIIEANQKGRGVDQRRSVTLGEDMLYSAHKLSNKLKIPGIDSEVAFIRVGIPLTQITHSLSDIRVTIIGISIIVLILVVIVTSVLTKPLVKPIHEISKVAKAIREGNLEQRIHFKSIGGNDEIGNLAETINDMIEKLNDDIVKLKKLERVRTEFLGNVSHELRTPIFALQAALETLLGGAIDDQNVNKDFLNKALNNARRLDALLFDLIEISRIESGDMKMSFRYFSLKEFLDQINDEMRTQAENKNITLNVFHLDEDIKVYADKDRMKQALANLIDNAIKYTASSGKINISYSKLPDSVLLSVSDTGYGILNEHLPHIFERFYRVDKDRSREAGGTGLGLAIVKHIVEAHGSKVEVKSEIGKGSTFSFKLKC
jgi:two-component system phosphate regulon sensor histidine kinase PhoR